MQVGRTLNIQTHGTSPLRRAQICHQASATLNSRAGAGAHLRITFSDEALARATACMHAQAVRSRAAFKRTLENVRKHMLDCTRDADLAGRSLGRPLEQRSKPNPRGPAVAPVYRTRNICDARAFNTRFCLVGGASEHAMRARPILERKLLCTRPSDTHRHNGPISCV